jgi:alcohol dehydrogenase, propanol-preferring
MRAAVVHEFHAPLVIEDRPTPTPGQGEVVVKLEASGLCHTDIHAAHGDWPVKPSPPFVPGHEGVGIVAAVGAGVARVHEGDRVAVPWLGWACGACEWCASGWETLCPHQRNTGYSVDGGFADYVLADAAFVGRVPDAVDPFDAAPLTCAGVTTYKAIKVSGARPSDLVGVFGIGGLGHLALQYAQIAGATVAAVDVVAHKLDVAKRLGAAYTVNPPRTIRWSSSRASAAPTPRSSSPPTPRCACRPTGHFAEAAASCSSACRPTTSSACRSSRPY